MRTSRIGRLIIDTADTLASAKSGDDRWWAITRIARQLGAEAVNSGAFNTATREVLWVRSSKDPMWLEEYDHAGFATVDPLVRGAVTGNAPLLIDIEADEKRSPASGKLRDWRATSMSYNYNYLVSHALYEGNNGTGVALSCRDDPTCLFGPGTLRAFSAVSALMAASLIEPVDDIHEGWAYGAEVRRLRPAERNVLAYIANGLPEYLIADVMKITEFEVWRLIRSASLKMGAKTKEEALARAISRGLVEP
ncbi:Autoinducer binding domain protein [Roseivivax jejudonensis]|uniref:Autoinducer binding domain protein n=1 Tax=Roseivivax jejudonensis TaxID=1529041 RepID=A0A1X6Y8D5_9RHOB|nr:Autoinducer binding domain protein [Roseivivax jejudonensis]